MQRPTGGELRAFEGLVHATAHMFAAQVRREEEDLAQELRVRVWRAVVTYDATKSSLSLERYVFQAVTNKIKDFKRDAAREARRREENGLTFLHIEDMILDRRPTEAVNGNGDHRPRQEMFDGLFYFTTREEVFGRIEDGLFTLPATITQREASVLVLLMLGWPRPEVAVRLEIARPDVDGCVLALREKFADWRPPGGSRLVRVAAVV